jgi:hypothetical protein
LDYGVEIYGTDDIFPSDDEYIRAQVLKRVAYMSVLGPLDTLQRDNLEAGLSKKGLVSCYPSGGSSRFAKVLGTHFCAGVKSSKGSQPVHILSQEHAASTSLQVANKEVLEHQDTKKNCPKSISPRKGRCWKVRKDGGG